MDEADRADERIAEAIGDQVAEARRAAGKIEAGIAGDCDFCGEWAGRLIGGACAGCRDRVARMNKINGKA